MEDSRRCTATANSTGKRCKNAAIKGGNVCPVHGGSAPQVKKKAQERLDEMADASTKRMQERLDEIFDRMDEPDLTHGEYVQLIRESRQLMTDILDRTGHGPTSKREVENTGDEPLTNVTIDFNDVDT